MKNNTRILAVLLAVTMTICTVPVNTITAKASSIDRTEESSIEEASEETETESAEESTAEAETEAETKTEIKETETKSSDSEEEPSAPEENAVPEQIPAETQTDEIAPQASTTVIDRKKLPTEMKATDSGVTVESVQHLILLSNCDPSWVQNLAITLNMTGTLDITSGVTAQLDGKTYTYRGIGTEESPFCGTINGAAVGFKIDTPFFGGLSSKAAVSLANIQDYLTLTWCAKAESAAQPMIAGVYQFDSTAEEGHKLPAHINVEKVAGTASAEVVMGSLVGTVQASQGCEQETLVIDSTTVNYQNSKAVAVSTATGNAGIICNTLKSGNIQLNGWAFPQNGYTVTSTAEYKTADETGQDISSDAGNAGGLIGVMGAGTTLQVENALNNITGSGTNQTTVPITVQATGNAGGLVGKMEYEASVKTGVSGSINLKGVTITGSVSAGGVFGDAINTDFSGLRGNITVNSPILKGDKAGANVGGFIGRAAFDKDGTIPTQVTITSPSLLITGTKEENGGNAGGYFGQLELKGSQITYTIGQDGDTKTNFSASYKENGSTGGNAWSYGSLIGRVTASYITSTLKIQNMEITSTYPIYGTSKENRPQYHGGVIGCIGASDADAGVYVKISKIQTTVKNPHATFGGAVGYLGKKCILRVQDLTVKTADGGQDAKIWEGGGVLGEAREGSVVEFSGTTDLSEVSYDITNKMVGQLVGKNESSLIYATGSGTDEGWTYVRSSFDSPSKGNTFNDLLCYGQVIRLNSGKAGAAGNLSSDLIAINESHNVTLKKIGNFDVDKKAVTIASADDFALLSILWNTRGYFGSESGITTENWSTIKNSTITLAADIDLTGTGITGFSRDTNTDDDTFTGILTSGTGNKITLAIGETYGYQKNTNTKPSLNQAGCGIVYATNSYHHNAQGLFAKADSAKIQNIVVDGTISVSNACSAITAGGIAAYMKAGSNADRAVTVEGVTAQETLYAEGSATQTMAVGGLFGTENGGWLNLRGNTVIAPKITLDKVSANGPWVSAGGVLGSASSSGFKLQVTSATVGNSANTEESYSYITTDTTNYAYIGGLIGLISTDSNEHWIEIYSLTMDGMKIEADSAEKVSGGLFGSIWEHVGVYFMGTGTQKQSMLTVKNCTVSASKANGVGGLAYRSSGIWEIRDYGVDIQSMSIQSGGDVGLLVCRGERGKTLINRLVEDTAANKGLWESIGALYLCTTAYWDTAYQLSGNDIAVTAGTNGVFDEFVAHTTPTAKEITDNGKNGVISIATKADGDGNSRVGVAESGTTCTTYQNRTTYGKEHQTNGCSRYYYDLDQWLKEASEDNDHNSNGVIDTSQELMLWSVWIYVGENSTNDIRTYLVRKNKDGSNETLYQVPDSAPSKPDRWKIQSPTNEYIVLDMQKYSYYPVTIGALSVNFINATIKFYNEEIEAAESAGTSANKSTQGSADVHTQHYTMHCGLLYAYQSPSATLTVNKVTFQGSVGKINDGTRSGALIASQTTGYLGTGGVPRYVAVTIIDSTLDGLKVVGCGEDYAPLLISQVGNYTTVTVRGLTTKNYTPGTAVASSLIGKVGDSKAKQINLVFEKIVLPDKKADGTTGIFSHATLLESFTHDGTSSGATYNFVKSEDWTGTKYVHQVTYGKEITETKEYKDLQKWYYDEVSSEKKKDYLVHEKDGQTDFSAAEYLPYVCEQNSYQEGGYNHEIKVNQRMDNIVNGCGTYGHPYVIRTEGEMSILQAYMSGGKAPQGWCVTITGNQSTNHAANGDYTSDVTYKYSSSNGWVKVKKTSGTSSENWLEDTAAKERMTDDAMRQYLLNAYYDLQGEQNADQKYVLELTAFGGFGNATRPFRGVLTSTTGATVILKGTAPTNGLIGYSYGCVVKDLTISYEQCSTMTLTYSSNYTYYANSVFGGVIGCVLGGDNVIDHVTVTYPKNWMTLSGDKKHLIPAGGYVGEVSGGGVILRNIQNTNAGLTDANINSGASGVQKGTSYSNLYVNPYVGRVLDGFAVYELTKTGTDADNLFSKLDNTEKNYQINTLDPSQDKNALKVSGTDRTVTVQNAKGLFVLSAIVNSGAAAGGSSNAYSSTVNTANKTVNDISYGFGSNYGKVRNASYEFIGKSVANAAADFELAKKDDQKVPAEENVPYLITKYAGGENAVFTLSGTNSGANIALIKDTTYDMTTFGSGYQGIGARYVSNAIRNDGTDNPNGIVPEIRTFDGNGGSIVVNAPVKEYTDDDFRVPAVGGVLNELRVGASGCTVRNLTVKGSNASAEVSLTYYGSDGKESKRSGSVVDVGGFAGTVSRISNCTTASAVFDTVNVETLQINAPRNAGGLLGSSTTKNITDSSTTEEKLLDGTSNVGVQLLNTKYSNIQIAGVNTAGGFVGVINNKATSFLKSTDSEAEDQIVGNSSNIQSGTGESYSTGDSSMTGAGGVFGYVKSDSVYLNASGSSADATVYKSAVLQDVSVSADQYAGGFIGKIDQSLYRLQQAKFIRKSQKAVVCTKVQAGTDDIKNSRNCYEGAGGIIGYAKGKNGSNIISQCSVENAQINEEVDANTKTNESRVGAGGIVGLISSGASTIQGCTVESSHIYGSVVGGIAGTALISTTFTGCTVAGTEKSRSVMKGYCTAGGILGYWEANSTATIQSCNVQYLNIDGKQWGVGALIGDGDSAGGNLCLYDTSAQDTTVSAAGGRWYQAGGIIGDLRSDLAASNILFSNVEINITRTTENTDHCGGLLVGKLDANNKNIRIAGVSIQNISTSCQDFTLIGNPGKEYKGYIAFADYSGAALEEAKQGKDGTLLGATAAAPYVVTSPKNEDLSVCEQKDASTASNLYGDGVSWTTSDAKSAVTMSKTIFEASNGGNGMHYAYEQSGVTEFDFTSAISMYNANQPKAAEKDFPVLQISGGDGDKVTQYLDILTNGGFTQANNVGDGHVTAKAEVYTYETDQDGKNGKFIKAVNADGTSVTPAFTVATDSTGKISFSSTTDYDNTRNRFTLLTVTFIEGGHAYNVFVPILVRRMLDVDFTATLTYGTNFKSSNYSTVGSHVLESFGSSVTGYLTYVYNSEDGMYRDYGWESYINAGGNVAQSMEKSVRFETATTENLPKGMQLTLVDPTSGKSYYYTATGEEKKSGNSFDIKLSAFLDSRNQPYQELSISELMKVQVEKSDGGTFIKVNEKGVPEGASAAGTKEYPQPTVKVKNAESGEYEYYRLADTASKETGAYKVTVPEANLVKEEKSLIQERYYLVMTIPKDTNITVMNGSVQTVLDTSIPHTIHYRKVVADENGYNDNHVNTASTYQLSSGYQQELKETGDNGASKQISVSDLDLRVDVTDTITFPSSQAYNANDQLYLRLTGNLQKTVNGETTSEQFPSGAAGTAFFYVYTGTAGNEQYYQYDAKDGWKPVSSKQAAASYRWTSVGENLELLLSEDGTLEKAISLQSLRDSLLKEQVYTFYVKAEMDLSLPAAGLDVIPESEVQNGQPKDYAKLAYGAQLSTEKQSLSYSSNRASAQYTTTMYYREEPVGAKLTYDADETDQLGINLWDLRYLDASREHSLIDTTAIYDLSEMKNLEEVLKNSNGIRFTLSLQPKKTETASQEEYADILDNANEYLSVKLRSAESGAKEDGFVDYDARENRWSWTVPRSAYWTSASTDAATGATETEGALRTDSPVFDGEALTQLIQLQVDVSKVKTLRHLYSNYKVVLSAEILGRDGQPVAGTNKTGSIIYTLARILPQFVEPQNGN